MPVDIADRIYTKNCNCVDLVEAKRLLDTTETTNLQAYVKARENYLIKYINSIFVHTSDPLLSDKFCRNKDFVLTNYLRDELGEHLKLLTLILSEVKDKRKTYYRFSPIFAKNLITIFGVTKFFKFAIIPDIFYKIQDFLTATLKLHEELAELHSPATAESLISFLKLEIVTIRLIQSYFKRETQIQNDIEPVLHTTT